MINYLLIFCIIAWGWFTQEIPSSVLMLVGMFVSTRYLPKRSLTLKQYYRLGNIISIGMLLAVIYLYASHSAGNPIYILLKWLPVCFFVAVYYQLVNKYNNLPVGTFFYSKRNEQVDYFDFRPYFSAICILSASSSNQHELIYFAISAVAFNLIILAAQKNKSSLILCCIILLPSNLIAYCGAEQIHVLHQLVGDKTVEWLTDWMVDPYKTQTSIGEMGRIKQSNEIVFRVKSPEPLLLQHTNYDHYLGKMWVSSSAAFAPITLNTHYKNDREITVFRTFKKTDMLLDLPLGVTSIEGLNGAELSKSGLGAISASNLDGFYSYHIFYDNKYTATPSKYDLEIPKIHDEWLTRIVNSLELSNKTDEEKIRRIADYFEKDFSYTLYSESKMYSEDALSYFINHKKAGHCEYFAVASALLLRKAGIPARLANGYSMHDFDETTKTYIVRKRNAHAWAIAFTNGHWINVDNTPSRWKDIEEENNASLFDPVYTLYSYISFNFDLITNKINSHMFDDIRLPNIESLLKYKLLIGQLGLAIFIVINLKSWIIWLSKKSLTRKNKLSSSPFFLIDKALKKGAGHRYTHESIGCWANRINDHELQRLAALHNQLRFDPNGLIDNDYKKFVVDVKLWLKQRATK